MGYKSTLKRIRGNQKRQTKTLREVVGTDLLTWKEKLIQGQVTGLYSLTNEEAYFQCPGDPASLTITEFERRLKAIDPMFVVVPCELDTPETVVQGHSIWYHVPALGGYIKVCNVGKNKDYTLPANSQGKIQTYKGDSFNRYGMLDEVPLLYRGWVAAEECCKTAYDKWEREGISPAMVINAKEVFNLRKAFTLVGAHSELEKAKLKHQEMLENDNAILTAHALENQEVLDTEENPVLESDSPEILAQENDCQ